MTADQKDPVAEIAQAAARFDFYAALRRIEARLPGPPRLGRSGSPRQDPVRLGQPPELEFPAATIAGVEHVAGVPWIRVRCFGLFGPNGPLPLHLTEYAYERTHQARDEGFAAFCDLFHHRLIGLFYRAWADKEPAVQHDRPGQDRYDFYLACLSGYGLPGQQALDAMPDPAKRHFAGRLASRTRNPDGLVALLRRMFGVRVALDEFVGEWLEIPGQDRCRLGRAALGRTAIGARSFQRAGTFQIRLGPLDWAAYASFLPDGEALPALVAVVRNWVGWDLRWSLRLALEPTSIPEPRLGGKGRLGWSFWLDTAPRSRPVDDLQFTPDHA